MVIKIGSSTGGCSGLGIPPGRLFMSTLSAGKFIVAAGLCTFVVWGTVVVEVLVVVVFTVVVWGGAVKDEAESKKFLAWGESKESVAWGTVVVYTVVKGC